MLDDTYSGGGYGDEVIEIPPMTLGPCDPPLVWDAASKACVAPYVPVGDQGLKPAAEPTFFEKYKIPLIVTAAVIGAAVIGYMWSAKSATPNPGRKRPPKPWMKHCTKGASKAKDPGAVCGALWYRKMSPRQRKAAKRKAYGK